MEMIRRNKNVKCPMPGCANAQPVHKNHLVDNVELRKFIEREQSAQDSDWTLQ